MALQSIDQAIGYGWLYYWVVVIGIPVIAGLLLWLALTGMEIRESLENIEESLGGGSGDAKNLGRGDLPYRGPPEPRDSMGRRVKKPGGP